MSSSKDCPKCGHIFKRADSWRFATWWGRRRVSSCPGCEVHLTWAPLMWRVGNASAVVVMGISLAYLFLRDSLPITLGWWIVDVSAAVLTLFSAHRRQLVRVPNAEGARHLQPGH